MGANMMNNNLDPATYGLTTKAQCREKITKLKIEIAELKARLVGAPKESAWGNSKEDLKRKIAYRKADIEKIKAHMEKCK